MKVVFYIFSRIIIRNQIKEIEFKENERWNKTDGYMTFRCVRIMSWTHLDDTPYIAVSCSHLGKKLLTLLVTSYIYKVASIH